MNLKPWLVYAQKTLCELHIPEDAYASLITDLAESWIGQLVGGAAAAAGTSANAAATVSSLNLSPPDDVPLSEAILYLASLQRQPEYQARKQNSGQYFTPLDLAVNLLDATVRSGVERTVDVRTKIAPTGIVRAETECTEFSDGGLTILDPACGSGVFLYAAARMAAQVSAPDKLDTARKRAAFVKDSLFGIEKDPLVARLARATLAAWILEGMGVGMGAYPSVVAGTGAGASAATQAKAAEGVGVGSGSRSRSGVRSGSGAKADAGAAAKARLDVIDISEATKIVTAKILCDDALLGDAWRSHHFDYVVGNPPFLGVRRGRIPDSEKAVLQRLFQTAQGQFDLYAIFVEDALTRIKEGGSIAFVLPRPLLSNDYSAPLRQLLARQATVHDILDFGKPFQAGVEIIGLVASGRPAASQGFAPADKASIRALPVMLFHTPENDLIGLVTRLAAEFHPLGDLTVSWRGLECGKRNAAITESPVSPDALPILRGSDVQRYAIQSPTRYYSPVAESSTAGKGGQGRSASALSNKFPAGKLLVRRVYPGLAAAYDPDPNLTLNTIYVMVAKPDCATAPYFSHLPWFLLGVINSGIASFWFKNAFVFRENLFPYVRLSQLRRLPCPPPNHPYAAQLAELARTLSLAHQKSSPANRQTPQQAKIQAELQLETLLADMLELSEPERQLIQSGLSQIGSK